MENNRLGLIGSSLLVGGLFLPIFTVALGGTLNFLGANHIIVSLSVLALGCIGIYACGRMEISRTPWVGAVAALILISSFAIAELRFAQIRTRFETQIAGNPFAQSARDSFQSPQIEWGWLVLIVGAALIIYASLAERRSLGIGTFAITDRTDRSYSLMAAVAFAAGLGMMGISQLNAPDPSSNQSPPDATSALAEDAANSIAAKTEAAAISKEKQGYISNYMAVYELDARYMDSMLDGRIPGVTFKLKNKGNRTLDQVEVTVEFLDASGKAISEQVYNPVIAGGYDSAPPLRPGHIWQNERGNFLAAKSVPSEWQSGRARASVTDIKFAEVDK